MGICFKRFTLVFGDNVQFSFGKGISEDSYRPYHPKFVPPQGAASVERTRAKDIEEIKKRIQAELH